MEDSNELTEARILRKGHSRNPVLELYRISLMFGIVLLHIVGTSDFGGSWRRLAYMLYPCVDGFVFIGGWFGIKFSWSKLLKLYGTAIWCCLLITLVQCRSLPINKTLLCLIDLFKEYWFLHAYAVLMCFAPLVDGLLEKEYGWRILLPPLFVIFGWGFLSHMAGLNHYLPQISGMEAKSGITLLGVYICGRLYRHLKIYDRLHPICAFALLVVALAVSSIGLGWLGSYNSPIAVLAAAMSFHLFERIGRERDSCHWSWITYVAPSVFAIYILHANPFVIDVMVHKVEFLVAQGVSEGISLLIVSVFCFITCLMMDSPRRAFLHLCRV